MSGEQYQLLAMAARFLFLGLAALAVARAAMDLLQQHRQRKKTMRQLPDAGMVGELRDVESDRSYQLPREGVLGSGRGCDIRLKGLRRRHVTFAYVPGHGIQIRPCHRRCAAWLDGVPLRRPSYALHGMLLRAGGYTLAVRLFAGLDVPEIAMYQDDWGGAEGIGGIWQRRAGGDEEIPLFDYTPQGPEAYAPQAAPPPAGREQYRAAPPEYGAVPEQPAGFPAEEEYAAPPAFGEDPRDFIPEPRGEEAPPLFTGDAPGTPAPRRRRSDRRNKP